jgi:hypothetical protein
VDLSKVISALALFGWIVVGPSFCLACGEYSATSEQEGLRIQAAPSKEVYSPGEEIRISICIKNNGPDSTRVLLDFEPYLTRSTIKPNGEPIHYKCIEAAPECEKWTNADTVLLPPGSFFGRQITHFPLKEPGKYRMKFHLVQYRCQNLSQMVNAELDSEEVEFRVHGE